MSEKRLQNIELLSGDGKTNELRKLFQLDFTQLEIDVALENAIAYSKTDTADYLLSIGAKFDNYNYQGVCYAVHNDELEGLRFAISKGVNINVNNGMLLNSSILTSINQKNSKITPWLLDNGADINLLTKESLDLIDKYGSGYLKSLLKNAT
jgi:hypothetical protein